MKPPDNERRVWTWARDRHGNEFWQIDSYTRPANGGDGFWFEAEPWEQKVLFWKEQDPKPDYEEGE